MAAITNPNNIPANKRASVASALVAIGPTVVPALYPKNADGTPKTSLSAAEQSAMFEAVTREFWRQQMEAAESEAATRAAREAVIAANAADPFG